jgi:RNA polymerase sigma factor (sigma-70 family)
VTKAITSADSRESEAYYLRLAQEGKTAAFAALFHTHKAQVYTLCLRMTSNATQAEYLTQQAFLQVFRRLAFFPPDLAFSTWLLRVAAATVLIHLRKSAAAQVSNSHSSASKAEIPQEVVRVEAQDPAASEIVGPARAAA